MHKDAKHLSRISLKELAKYTQLGVPGSYGVLDRLAIQTIFKRRIKTIIINGSEPRNIIRAIKGEEIGTLIA